MKQYVPGWNLEVNFGQHGDILPKASQKNPVCQENDLVELLWQNGHLVMHSQNNQKASALRCEFKSIQEEEPINLIQAHQMAPWFQNPIYDSLEKDLGSQLFSEMVGVNTTCADNMNTEVYAKDERCIEVGSSRESNVLAATDPCQPTLHLQDIVTMPLQKSQGFDAFNYFDSPRPLTGKLDEKESRSGTMVGQNSSMMTNGSSICGSNQIHAKADLSSTDVTGVAGGSKEGAGICFPIQSEQKHACESTFLSSSGGSGLCTRSTGVHGGISGCQKRKQRDVDGLEDQSENVDESLDAKKPRRNRAAEIHNRSERVRNEDELSTRIKDINLRKRWLIKNSFTRTLCIACMLLTIRCYLMQRRRDRINERMKALQELIPHCNKTDKASLLDEAIEYLKSLQLQLQIMWTRSRMAQMMYPGVQQYMSGMGMGLAHASVPSMHHAVQLPSVRVVNQSVGSPSGTNQALFYPSPALHATDLQNLMQSSQCKESHALCPGFHHLHPHSQVMHQFALGSCILQQNQHTATPSSSSLPSSGKGPSENNANDSESG